MPDEAAQRRSFADKAAILLPGDEILMDIGGKHAGRRPRLVSRLRLRDCRDPASGQEREERLGEAVPWRYQDREGAIPEQRPQPTSPGVEIGRHRLNRSLCRVFALLCPVSRTVIGMAPAVL